MRKEVIGDCELWLGDCREVAAVITDPPYGIDYQSAWRIDKAQWKPKIANDGQPFVWFLPDAFRAASDAACLLCFCRWDVQGAFHSAIEWAGWDLKSQIVWDREAHGMGDLNGCPAPQHDIVWFAVKGKFQFVGDRPRSVIRSPRLGGEELVHPNQKPEGLICDMVQSYSTPGDTVLDFFLGSGTTGVACVRLGRKFIGIEIEPKYFDIACKRIEREVQLAKCDLFKPKPAVETQRQLITEE